MRKEPRFLPQLSFLVAICSGIMLIPAASFAAVSLKAAPTSISFGSVAVNGSVSVTETITNNGTSSVTISAVTVSGAYQVSGITTPLRLWRGRSYAFTVKFLPQTIGTLTGTLKLTSNAPSVSVELSGTGLAAATLSISPTSYSFGNVTVGTTASQSATLKAGTASVSVSNATTTNSEFTLSGLTLPLTLAAGQSLGITVNFHPTASGSTSAQISLTGSSGTTTASASGSGVAATQHQVNLTWTPSTSTAAGYNVYRGTASGGPYSRLTSSSLVSASYSDSSVAAGSTYFYVTTAVSSSGTESANSNEAKAVVPTP